MEYYEFDKMDNERYLSCYENCMQLSSDLSPYSLLALRDEPVCARRAYDYGLCFHRGYFGGELCYSPPVGDWDAADWEEAEELWERFGSGGYHSVSPQSPWPRCWKRLSMLMS
ncbi:MAG: hypothetical protein IKO41_06565, partial [Lachnospiraceae bacterium]|nr:hypothetical protein [Lachnospiraceae bacterium]